MVQTSVAEVSRETKRKPAFVKFAIPDHLAEKQRRDDGDEDERLDRHIGGEHQCISERVAHDQGEKRREEANPDRVDEDPGVKRLEQSGEIGEREAAGIERARNISAQAVLQHRDHRDGESECAERRRRHEGAEEGLLCHGRPIARDKRTAAVV